MAPDGAVNGQSHLETNQKVNEPYDSWKQVFAGFLNSSSLHGVKHVAEAKHGLPFRRLAWTLLVLGATVLFMYQSGSRVSEYFNYRTNINIEIQHNDTLAFPAVTLCNLNFARKTKVYEMGLYEVVDQTFDESSGGHVDIPDNLVNTSSAHFIEQAGHDITNLIESCYWNDQPCKDGDFKLTHSDLGLCFTFNHGHNDSEIKEMLNPGLQHGLRLVMNIESYDHMKGLVSAAGVKVMLHDQHEVPLMRDLGFSIPSGSHTLVGIKLDESHSLPEPWGRCADTSLLYHGRYSQSACLLECMSHSSMGHCGCVAPFMVTTSPSVDNETSADAMHRSTCSLEKYFKCIVPLLGNYSELVGHCSCPMACNRKSFQASLSYSSAANMVGLIGDEGRRAEIHQALLNGRETSQRTDLEILQADKQSLESLIKQLSSTKLHQAHNLFQKAGVAATNPLAEFASEFASKSPDSDWQNLRGYIVEKYEVYKTTYKRQVRSMKTYHQNVLSTLAEAISGDLLTIFEGKMTPNTSNNLIPSLVHNLDQYIEDAVVAAEKPLRLLTLLRTDATLLYKGLPEEKFKLLPSNMLRKEGIITDAVMRYTFFGVSSANIARIDTERVLVSLHDNFSSLTSTLKTMKRSAVLQWPTSFDLDAFEKVLNELSEDVNQLNEKTMSEVDDHVDWVTQRYDWTFWQVNQWGYDAHLKYTALDAKYVNMAEILDNLYRTASDESASLDTMLKTYLQGTRTKHDLAVYFASPRVEGIREKLKLFQNNAYLDYRDYETYMRGLLNYYQRSIQAYVGWYLLMDSEMIDDRFMRMSNLIRFSRGQNGSYCDRLVDAIIPRKQLVNASTEVKLEHADNTTRCFTEAWEQVETTRNTRMMIAGQSLDVVVGAIVSKVETLMEETQQRLREYERGNKMDDGFFRVNFLQLDIFYEDFSYETVIQQESFHALSLFSEIGGFMGLLLGGSVLTLFELLDAVTVNCLKKIRKNPARPAPD